MATQEVELICSKMELINVDHRSFFTANLRFTRRRRTSLPDRPYFWWSALTRSYVWRGGGVSRAVYVHRRLDAKE